MQQIERRLERIAMLNRRRIRKHDALDELRPVIERIHERRDTRVIRAAHEAERFRVARIGERHRSTTSSAGSRRL